MPKKSGKCDAIKLTKLTNIPSNVLRILGRLCKIPAAIFLITSIPFARNSGILESNVFNIEIAVFEILSTTVGRQDTIP